MSLAARLRELPRRVFDGYRAIGSTLLQAVVLLAAALLVSGGIVVPLWLAATRATAVYTSAVLWLAAAALLLALVRRIRGQSAGVFLPILKTTARVLVIVAGLYAMVVLFARGLPLAAAVIALAGLVWLGYAASGGRTRHDADGAP
jgi:hypothetical protein